MKLELFVIRNMQGTVPTKKCSEESPKNKSYAEAASTTSSNPVLNISPQVPQPQPRMPAQQKTSQMSPKSQHQPCSYPKPFKAPVKHNHDSSKILFVGDSISRNINIKVIENATGKEIVCKKAYSAVHDTNEYVAKKSCNFS